MPPFPLPLSSPCPVQIHSFNLKLSCWESIIEKKEINVFSAYFGSDFEMVKITFVIFKILLKINSLFNFTLLITIFILLKLISNHYKQVIFKITKVILTI